MGVVPVSQFTLLASMKKGNKPDFHGAAGGEDARRLYQYFFDKVRQGYAPNKVQDGVFQAMMEVALVNDGPVRASSLSASWKLTNHVPRSRWNYQLIPKPTQRLSQFPRPPLVRLTRLDSDGRSSRPRIYL